MATKFRLIILAVGEVCAQLSEVGPSEKQ